VLGIPLELDGWEVGLAKVLHFLTNRPDGHSLGGAILLIQDINDLPEIVPRFRATTSLNFRPESNWILVAGAVAVNGE
jgi:hypothetical protein